MNTKQFHRSRWTKTVIPTSVLIAVFATCGLTFAAEQLGLSLGAGWQKEVASLQDAQAAYGGISSSTVTSLGTFTCAISPFGAVPDWGAMTTDAQFSRSFCQIDPKEFVPPPTYDIAALQTPAASLHAAANSSDAAVLTAKLFYSTRYMGKYDLDSADLVNLGHPAIDYKMPLGTPIRAIAAGTVDSVVDDGAKDLGLHVTIRHVLPTHETVYSIYGHMQQAMVNAGDVVETGQTIGTVGCTGNCTKPHLHLQIDRDRGEKVHTPYVAPPGATRSDVTRWTINPVDFIGQH